MAIGIVKWFSNEKGHGFFEVLSECKWKNEDIFAHHKQIQGDGYKMLIKGQVVEFDIDTNDRGANATQIQALLNQRALQENAGLLVDLKAVVFVNI